MTDYKNRTLRNLLAALATVRDVRHALDFGSGDGWYAAQFLKLKCFDYIDAIDVKLRDAVHYVPTIYSGTTPLPFADRAFDIVYAVDVLHHCPSPHESILELSRVADRYILIKDHSYRTWAGACVLAVLDELGNRRFGIPSPHNYQRAWEWTELLERQGWSEIYRIWPATSHHGLLGRLTNRLQHVSLFRRNEASS